MRAAHHGGIQRPMSGIWRVRSLVASACLFLAARAAWADEDDVPIDPRVVEPGFKLLGVLILVGVALVVWYQLRKRALLRSRTQDRGIEKPGSP